MKTEIRDMWADALESGEYTQGQSRLTAVKADGTETDCCLGVLCKLAVKAGVIPEPEVVEDPCGDRKAYGADKAEGLLPGEVIVWAETEGRDTVIFECNGYTQTAETLNDVHGLTFKEIAKLIREQL